MPRTMMSLTDIRQNVSHRVDQDRPLRMRVQVVVRHPKEQCYIPCSPVSYGRSEDLRYEITCFTKKNSATSPALQTQVTVRT